jgi:ABC-type lipoprotein release transport system permease subunit
VLGNGLAAELGNDRPEKRPLTVGETFPLGARVWKVVGILDSTGSTFDSEVWAKRTRVGEDFGKQNMFSSYLIRTDGPSAALALTESLKNYKKAALNPQLETEYFSKQGETGKQFLVAIILVAVVMAVGGVFGVMNTMYAAISQRTKDIGVLRILGYARWQILVSFLLESLVIALLGGILGCAIGMIADGWTARSVVSNGPGGGKSVVLQMVVSPEILMTGTLLSLGMGGLGGFLPAVTAMRLRALESLR